MSKPYVSETPLTAEQTTHINLAVKAIEHELKGRVLGLICQDEEGIYVTYRDGTGAAVAATMGRVNWWLATRLAEEHTR